MQTDSTGVQKTPDASLLERAKKANETASTVYALIEICRAAAEFADEQDRGYMLADHVPANLSTVLNLTKELVLDMTEVFERVIVEEGNRAC